MNKLASPFLCFFVWLGVSSSAMCMEDGSSQLQPNLQRNHSLHSISVEKLDVKHDAGIITLQQKRVSIINKRIEETEAVMKLISNSNGQDDLYTMRVRDLIDALNNLKSAPDIAAMSNKKFDNTVARIYGKYFPQEGF
ncbi:MAG: hypothetical protein K0R76_393 [Alphaproteobacteria bacterium]|nr:hypothetical protein [Alphaproteobacteria bacterium]